MLNKLITLAATTAMLAANAAAHAVDAARTAIKGLGGNAAAGEVPKPVDGTKIQPSIPPMPPMEQAQPAPRKGADKKVAADKDTKKDTKTTNSTKAAAATKGTKAGKATKARARTAGSGVKATLRKSRNSNRHASK